MGGFGDGILNYRPGNTRAMFIPSKHFLYRTEVFEGGIGGGVLVKVLDAYDQAPVHCPYIVFAQTINSGIS